MYCGVLQSVDCWSVYRNSEQNQFDRMWYAGTRLIAFGHLSHTPRGFSCCLSYYFMLLLLCCCYNIVAIILLLFVRLLIVLMVAVLAAHRPVVFVSSRYSFALLFVLLDQLSTPNSILTHIDRTNCLNNIKFTPDLAILHNYLIINGF